MTMTCLDCNQRLDHCHGTLILHTVGFAECSDPECREVVRYRHALVVECGAFVHCPVCTGAG